MTTFLASLLLAPGAFAETVRTVALTGHPAPGTSGAATYESFGSLLANESFNYGVVLNNAGQVAFRANLAGDGVDFTNNQGVWSEGSGSLALVARTGSQAPGTPMGVNFSTDPALELFLPVLNDVGKTAFYAATSDGKLGLWSEGSGSLAAAARGGQQSPGTPSGVAFTFANLYEYLEPPILNNAGRVAFRSYLSGEGVNNSNNFGLWSEGSGNLTLLARLGSQATGLPAGVTHGFAYAAGLNDAGQCIFFSLLSGASVDGNNDRSLFSDISGSLSLVARSGSQAPGMPDGVNFNRVTNSAAINNASQIAFVAGLTSANSPHGQDSLWLHEAGSYSPLAVRGSQAPGTPDGVFYDYIGYWPELNDAGQVLFSASLMGNGVVTGNEFAFFLSDSAGNAELVVRLGDHLPGTPDGSVLGLSSIPMSNAPALNDAGQVAFMAAIAGPGVNAANDIGIWATNVAGSLQPIAREGDELEVAAGDVRTIAELIFVGDAGSSNGWPSGFNDRGQLAFWASFTDGSQGVFVSDVVAHQPGDFTADGVVDGGDFLAWQRGESPSPLSANDLAEWQNHFGAGAAAAAHDAVPEPGTLLLLGVGLGAFRSRGRAARRANSRARLAANPPARVVR